MIKMNFSKILTYDIPFDSKFNAAKTLQKTMSGNEQQTSYFLKIIMNVNKFWKQPLLGIISQKYLTCLFNIHNNTN